MIHWKGHGYLAIATPAVVLLAGYKINDHFFHGQIPFARTAGVSCILAACLIALMLRVFPNLRSIDFHINQDINRNTVPNCGKVESFISIEKFKAILGKDREVYRNSLLWIPLEVYVPIWVAIGIWYYWWK
jgi:hypothetical protein